MPGSVKGRWKSAEARSAREEDEATPPPADRKASPFRFAASAACGSLDVPVGIVVTKS